METVIEAPNGLKVIGEYDVVICGGGPAGVSAAVSAARCGAKTSIIERYGYTGGLATGSLVILIVGLTDGQNRIIKGFCEETIKRLEAINSTRNVGPHVLFDPESMKYLFDCFIEENNIRPYYHRYISGTVVEDERITGVIVEGKSGREVIKGKVFVDATGDADLAKYSGVSFDIEPKEKLMPVTLGFRVGGLDAAQVLKFYQENPAKYKGLLEDLGISTRIGGWIETLHSGEAWFNIAHISNINGVDSDDLTKAEIIGRKHVFRIMESFRQNIPGFENGYLIDTTPQMGVRETRRIKGVYRFTDKDVEKRFDDVICKAPNYTGVGAGSVEVPFRCLLVKNMKNLIFAGRCISAESKLLDTFREIPCCFATGQAAGIAGALAVSKNDVHAIDIARLQSVLLEQGAYLPKSPAVYS